jgi:hypothetical protein
VLSARSIILLILVAAFPLALLLLTPTIICRTNGTGCGPTGPDYALMSMVLFGEAGLILGLVLNVADDERE